MKNFIFGILTSLLLVFCTAATPVANNLLTVKPAIPISTAVFEERYPTDNIKSYIKQGYVIQSITAYGNHTAGWYMVVMVKY